MQSTKPSGPTTSASFPMSVPGLGSQAVTMATISATESVVPTSRKQLVTATTLMVRQR
jgi:hypothetical protein